jgi:hypothetical protein
MELHSLALFWRDQQACCFTSFRFYDSVDPLKRARKMAECMETLSTLQLWDRSFLECELTEIPSQISKTNYS